MELSKYNKVNSLSERRVYFNRYTLNHIQVHWNLPSHRRCNPKFRVTPMSAGWLALRLVTVWYVVATERWIRYNSAQRFTMGTGSFLGVKWPGRSANSPSHLTPWLKKSRAIHLQYLWAFMSGSRVNFTLFLHALLSLVWVCWNIWKEIALYTETRNDDIMKQVLVSLGTVRLAVLLSSVFVGISQLVLTEWNWICTAQKYVTQDAFHLLRAERILHCIY